VRIIADFQTRSPDISKFPTKNFITYISRRHSETLEISLQELNSWTFTILN